ncbi:MAG: cytochrome C oxidase subunit IV family protein [Bacteroidia bacterium]
MSATTDNGAATRKRIWSTTGWLTAITTLEFIIAFGMTSPDMYIIKVGIFMILTLVKAYLIVSIFMHLGDEVKRLIWSIGIPFVFIMWLLIAMVREGSHYGENAVTKKAEGTKTEQPAAPANHGGGH